MNAERLIQEARRMTALERPETAGLWARAAALLGRQAIEEALADFWRLRAPGLENASWRAQWTCLPNYLRDDAAISDASFAWQAFTRACHHHHYELAPTAGELRHWLDLAEAWCAKVAALTAEGTPPGAQSA